MTHRTVWFAVAVAALAGAGFAPPARAADPAEPVAAVARCRAIPEAAVRLACYDALASGPGPAAWAPPAATATARFGFENRTVRSAPDSVESRIPGYFEGWGPKSRIGLANGQVWQVIDDSRGVVERRDPAVKVTRAALGTFFLEIEGHHQAPRVSRVE